LPLELKPSLIRKLNAIVGGYGYGELVMQKRGSTDEFYELGRRRPQGLSRRRRRHVISTTNI
jgi:hypothetical protein